MIATAAQWLSDILRPEWPTTVSNRDHHESWVGLRESSFLLLEYSVEYLIEYSSTRWIPEVAINHRVVQSKRIPGSLFKFVI